MTVKSALHWVGAVALGLIALIVALPLIGAAVGMMLFILKLALGVAIVVFVVGLIRRLLRAGPGPHPRPPLPRGEGEYWGLFELE
jgi:hypothetical protein